MILVTMKAECPYCGSTQDREFLISSEIEGNYATHCDDCDKRFLISWFLIADSEVHRIEDVRPPVKCTAKLEPFEEGEDWSEDGNDHQTIES